MNAALHVTTTVQPGNKIEITAPELAEGQTVHVFVLESEPVSSDYRSVVDFLKSLPPGPRSFKTWEEFEKHFQEERDSWDR